MNPEKKFILIAILTMILTGLHLVYSWTGGLYLYEQSGGITHQANGWTGYGGASFAWTIPLQLPGCAILITDEKAHGRHSQTGWVFLGVSLVLMGSVITAFALALSLVALIERTNLLWGHYRWRLVLVVLGLIWIPVPESYAWVYQYTVIY